MIWRCVGAITSERACATHRFGRDKGNSMQKASPPELTASLAKAGTFSIVVALSFAHLLNDMMQSLLPAIYPLIKGSYGLNFAQIGLITLTLLLTGFAAQPVVGICTDRRPHLRAWLWAHGRVPCGFFYAGLLCSLCGFFVSIWIDLLVLACC
jgi:MFS family permease